LTWSLSDLARQFLPPLSLGGRHLVSPSEFRSAGPYCLSRATFFYPSRAPRRIVAFPRPFVSDWSFEDVVRYPPRARVFLWCVFFLLAFFRVLFLLYTPNPEVRLSCSSRPPIVDHSVPWPTLFTPPGSSNFRWPCCSPLDSCSYVPSS